MNPVQTLEWMGDENGFLRLLDQRRLPAECTQLDCQKVDDVWQAIRTLAVRGAPAIGIAAAYGVCLAAQGTRGEPAANVIERVKSAANHLATSRPTAVNLFWALDRMTALAAAGSSAEGGDALRQRLLVEALAMHEEDRQQGLAIGRLGAALLGTGAGVLTHCNAGGLATGGEGTALAVLFAAQQAGKRPQVFVDETRPLLQGSRLTAWELAQRGIAATLICDSAAAGVMRSGRVQAVVVGADRIAANGDVANKVGTYGVAVSAAAHGIPFYVAAPTSTFDFTLASGDEIPIEERSAEEITELAGQQLAPSGVQVFNPAFDVTPAHLIAAIICERGLIRPVTRETVAAVAGEAASGRN